jgi:hypothetical protein
LRIDRCGEEIHASYARNLSRLRYYQKTYDDYV